MRDHFKDYEEAKAKLTLPILEYDVEYTDGGKDRYASVGQKTICLSFNREGIAINFARETRIRTVKRFGMWRSLSTPNYFDLLDAPSPY
jgi:hypothetical protein